ncbi:MAG: choice-of-anchor D domain-containing protein [Ignavibacteria bacterium]|nr:choice-of-anchor D domain-containing protein [Ignavibacteria bacterium]
MRKLCLLAAFAVFAVQVMTAGGDNTQAVEPGIDTMPPVLTMQSLPCGVREFTATETRNIPDPPRATPNERDQVERGIQSIRLALDPQAQNIKLTLINPTTFPKDPKVTSATFQVALIDASKGGSCVVEVRDWNNNLTTRQITIGAATPTLSAAAINVGLIKVGQNGQGTLTVTNNTGAPLVITSITLANGTRFAVTAGGGSVTIPAGGTHTIAFSYTPIIGSEAGDSDVLTVATACGDVTCALSGTGGVSRISTTPALTFDETRADYEDCTPTGPTEITISNTGNVAMSVIDWTFNNTEFYAAAGAPSKPVAVAAGASVTISVCLKKSTLGVATGTVTFTNDATDGADNVTSLNGNITTGVEDEMGKTARVWFDAANEQIVFTTVRVNSPVFVHDINGRVLASSTVSDAGSFRINTSAWNNGVVVITYSDENGQRTRTLSIVR